MTRLSACIAAMFVLLTGAHGSASPQTRDTRVTPATGGISGMLVMADRVAAPVRSATIELTGPTVRLFALTDDAGRFAFTRLPSGQYEVRASKAGYLPAVFGATRPLGAGTPVAVGIGQQVSGLTLAISRGAVMSGTVFDERGLPVPYLAVRALRYVFSPQTGETLPQPVQIGTGEATCDDEGRFRFYGLAPGDYIVSAATDKRGLEGTARQTTPLDVQWALGLLRRPATTAAPVDNRSRPAPTVRPIGNAPVFHLSGQSASDATRITLGVGEERAGIDVQLGVAKLATVFGGVIGTSSAIRSGGTVTLIDDASTFELSSRWGFDGSFRMEAVPPGRYTVFANSDGQPVRGRSDVWVDSQDVMTSIALQPGATLAGRVAAEGAPADETAVVTLSLLSTSRSEAMSWSKSVRGEGTFAFPAFPIGTYRLLATVSGGESPGWRVKSAMRGDQDLLDGGLALGVGENITDVVVTLTRNRSEISGQLVDGTGAAATRYSIIVFSADAALRGLQSRRTQMVRPATDGGFAARDLPAGDYLIAAVTDVEPGQWHDKAFLAELAPYSVKVTLSDGEKKVQNIRLGGGG